MLFLILSFCRDIKLLVHIVVSRFVDGPSHSFEVEVGATSTHFMESRVIGMGDLTYYYLLMLHDLCYVFGFGGLTFVPVSCYNLDFSF